MKKVSRYDYETIYAFNKLSKRWLEEVNNNIKINGMDQTITYNEDKNIKLNTRKAHAKWSSEDKAKIKALTDTMTPINLGAIEQYITVEHIGKATQSKLEEAMSILSTQEDNTALANVAKLLLEYYEN